MKKIVFILASLVVAVLVIGKNAFAQDKTPKTSIPDPSLGPEWKLLSRGYNNSPTFYVNTKWITPLPKGIVKVWVLSVPRGELRRTVVNILKNDLFSKGENQNNAERLWYATFLYKLNCKKYQFAELDGIYYSFEQVPLFYESPQYEKWYDIPPRSVIETVEKYVCSKAFLSIPDPSLGSEWKPLGMDSDLSTLYVNTRKITYLPGGIVKVRTLWVIRGKWRRKIVNALKHILLSEGKDPNKAERFWYGIDLDKINCKKHQSASLETTAYSFEKAVLYHRSFHHEEWKDISPRSIDEVIEKYVCKEYK